MEFSKEELVELVDAFNSKIDRYQKEFDDFKNTFNEFLDKAESNYRDWDHTTRLGEFKEKYKDSIDPIAEDVKKAERKDDFDLGTRLFDDYEASDKSVPEEEYVANVVASLTEQLNKLKEATGAEEVEIKADENGEATVKADGEKIAEAKEISPENAPTEGNEAESPNESKGNSGDCFDDDYLEKEYSRYEKAYHI